jgi:serine/threonine protein kinase
MDGRVGFEVAVSAATGELRAGVAVERAEAARVSGAIRVMRGQVERAREAAAAAMTDRDAMRRELIATAADRDAARVEATHLSADATRAAVAAMGPAGLPGELSVHHLRYIRSGPDAVVFSGTAHGRVYVGTYREKPCYVLELASGDALEIKRVLKLVGRVDHPNIVAILGGGSLVPLTYELLLHGLLFEHCSGGSVRLRLNSGGARPVPIRARLTWMQQALLALAYLHRFGVIHGDVKPENVLLEDESPTARAKLWVWESVVAVSAPAEELAVARGSPAFMDADGIRRCLGTDGAAIPLVTTASDVYSAGVMLWAILTGRQPFDTRTFHGETSRALRALWAHVVEGVRPASPAELAALTPPGIGALIGRMWAARAEDRPTAAAAFCELGWLIAAMPGEGAGAAGGAGRA